jgi:Leucine-rich repeat (LRR) protein|tara:strand:+ start:114 stop:665 length:552 start_codon:yes stop_codon:yes gene_type:complete
MNEIRTLPQKLSFPMLKILNLNRNQDLAALSLDYCPFLEQVLASYCSIASLGDFAGCPNLQQLDISFNKIASLKTLLQCLFTNVKMVSMLLNDNVFNFNVPPEWQQHYGFHFLRIFPALSRLNGEALEMKAPSADAPSSSDNRRYSNYKFQRDLALCFKNYVSKVMSQKIRITFESTTYMMKY